MRTAALTAGDGEQVGAEPAPWLVLGALVIAAGIGLAMARRWSAARTRRRRGGPAARRSAVADQSIAAPLVHGHRLFRVVTIVLVLLVALDVGT